MKSYFLSAAILVASVLSGCAAPPQQPLAVSQEFSKSTGAKVGVVLTNLPKVDTEFPGAGCLLCLAAASLNHKSLTAQVQTWPTDDITKVKSDLVKALQDKGLSAKEIEAPLVLKQLPSYDSKAPNMARQDFRGVKNQYQVDKLLVVDITALGVWRNYSAYIPTGAPQAVVKGTAYIVNLESNALEWYLPLNVAKGSSGEWDEPPKFPGLTSAYFEAIEEAKENLVQPFKQ